MRRDHMTLGGGKIKNWVGGRRSEGGREDRNQSDCTHRIVTIHSPSLSPLFQVGQQQQQQLPADQSQSQSGLSWSRSSSLRKHLSRRSLSSSRIDQVGDNNAHSNAIKVRCLYISLFWIIFIDCFIWFCLFNYV